MMIYDRPLNTRMLFVECRHCSRAFDKTALIFVALLLDLGAPLFPVAVDVKPLPQLSSLYLLDGTKH